ncbi:hypothetical protein [Rhodophyticola sp.]|jgi:hypothetical protein|uniref:hypothetical protein n=1 Tax=Rhodophyticola sp. TaxID=2680032 RepID=UPI003D296BF5
MIDPKGTWTAQEGGDGGPKSVRLAKEGDAWRVTHLQRTGYPELHGVGFTYKGFLCIARGLVQQAADLGDVVGLVKYDITQFGELPAAWYHCSLNGQLSTGLSSGGPSTSLLGEYRADYSSGDGAAFNPLRKTISMEGDAMRFAWWDDERFHYLGIGQMVAGSLFAAWGPPGALVQFAFYDLDTEDGTLQGQWWDLGRSFSGSETLIKI